jgi:hypothetical protein
MKIKISGGRVVDPVGRKKLKRTILIEYSSSSKR